MTIESVQYSLQDQVAMIRIDDGKRNALSPLVLREINQGCAHLLPVYPYAITSNGIFRTCERFADFLACQRS